jgi:hypothetical protein
MSTQTWPPHLSVAGVNVAVMLAHVLPSFGACPTHARAQDPCCHYSLPHNMLQRFAHCMWASQVVPWCQLVRVWFARAFMHDAHMH